MLHNFILLYLVIFICEDKSIECFILYKRERKTKMKKKKQTNKTETTYNFCPQNSNGSSHSNITCKVFTMQNILVNIWITGYYKKKYKKLNYKNTQKPTIGIYHVNHMSLLEVTMCEESGYELWASYTIVSPSWFCMHDPPVETSLHASHFIHYF